MFLLKLSVYIIYLFIFTNCLTAEFLDSDSGINPPPIRESHEALQMA